jgi:phosphotransferase system enzyme I (PtsP)
MSAKEGPPEGAPQGPASAPQVPVQILGASERLDAALRFAAGPARGSSLASALGFLCEQIAQLLDAPIASVYVLEERDELVLRANHGFPEEALGEVRLHVGQGITGTAVETLRPVTVADARLAEQFAYFPQLAEERYPAFLAVPLLEGGRPRGALVLQREKGPFDASDLLLAVAVTPALTALIRGANPKGAGAVLRGAGNGRGRALGQVFLLSRALPRRSGDARRAADGEEAGPLAQAFAAEREELRGLIARARASLGQQPRVLDDIASVIEDARTEERALELVARGQPASLALERVAGEAAKALALAGASSLRAVDVEAFLGAVAHRLAGLDSGRIRRGEVLVGLHLPGPSALRAWAAEATGAVCANQAGESTGTALLTALGVPVLAGARSVFEWVGSGTRVALDGDAGELHVNPSAAQAAEWRR